MSSVLIIGNNDMGLYKFRRELVQNLLDNNFTVMVSAPYGSYIPMLENIGCTYIPIEYNRRNKNLFRELNLLFKYYRVIRKSQYDVVILYTIKPVLYAGIVCRIKKIPYLANITGLSPALTEGKILRHLCFFMYRRVLPKANMVFFQNKSNLEIFQKENAIGKNFTLLPGSGVNLKEHTYEAYAEGDKLRILYVGRITKIKGIAELLDAIEILNRNTNQLVFEFLGSCDEMFIEQINQLNADGKIIYYGQQDNPHDYMKKVQAIIMPSYGEGMSNVLLEAAASGRPILASNVAGCKEIVIEGETGFLFEPRSAKSIVDAIYRLQSLTKEQREEMGRKGREYVESRFSREIVVQESMNYIKKCLEEKNESV